MRADWSRTADEDLENRGDESVVVDFVLTHQISNEEPRKIVRLYTLPRKRGDRVQKVSVPIRSVSASGTCCGLGPDSPMNFASAAATGAGPYWSVSSPCAKSGKTCWDRG